MDIANINIAIKEFTSLLASRFGSEVETYLYGSVARNTHDESSDIDLIVLMPFPVNNSLEETVFDMAFDLELKYNVIFSVIVYSKEEWESPTLSQMPLHESIAREGIHL